MSTQGKDATPLTRAEIIARLWWATGAGFLAFCVLITLGAAVAGRSVRQFMEAGVDGAVLAWVACAVVGLFLAWLTARLALRAANHVRSAGRRSAVVGTVGLYLALLAAVLYSSLVTQAISDGTIVSVLGTSGAMTGGQAVLGLSAIVLTVFAVIVLRRWYRELPDAEEI
ncbi:MAG: hypothetical protein GX593_03620 [Actinomycetales bacterium]|nr:hypothetical protein [Actinomycetales bacterium]